MGSVWENDSSRRTELRDFARKALVRTNKCAALHDIIAKAAALASSLASPADVLIGDLMAVMIGEGMLSGRNHGTHFVGLDKAYLGALGFKCDLRDDYFQVQHAVAGIVIGYQYIRPTQWLVQWLEREKQDILLYQATFPLGRTLNDANYGTLADRFTAAVCMANAAAACN